MNNIFSNIEIKMIPNLFGLKMIPNLFSQKIAPNLFRSKTGANLSASPLKFYSARFLAEHGTIKSFKSLAIQRYGKRTIRFISIPTR